MGQSLTTLLEGATPTARGAVLMTALVATVFLLREGQADAVRRKLQATATKKANDSRGKSSFVEDLSADDVDQNIIGMPVVRLLELLREGTIRSTGML